VITSAGNLDAKYVIHAVGPVWGGGHSGEEADLASAYQAALELAASHDCQSVALPALSTGTYRYPLDQAARIAVAVAVAFLRGLPADHPMEAVRFVLFSDDILAAFSRSLGDSMAHLGNS
jgi:O-acetyl-ADP-ribose deacetylase (regulator of RNase III)